MMFKNLSIWFVYGAIAVAATSCGSSSATKPEKVDGVEWNVTVNKCVEFEDAILGISTNRDYMVADTAAVNALMKGVRRRLIVKSLPATAR